MPIFLTLFPLETIASPFPNLSLAPYCDEETAFSPLCKDPDDLADYVIDEATRTMRFKESIYWRELVTRPDLRDRVYVFNFVLLKPLEKIAYCKLFLIGIFILIHEPYAFFSFTYKALADEKIQPA